MGIKKRIRFLFILFGLLLLLPLVSVAKYGIFTPESLKNHERNPVNAENWSLLGRILDRNLSPLAFNKDGERSYPLGEKAANVTGYANPKYSRVGLEGALADRLRGFSVPRSPSEAIVLANKSGRYGDDVVTSIDSALQSAAYDALYGYRGAAVVLDVKNGDVLAMASRPSYNPNFSALDRDWQAINTDSEEAPLFDRAKQGSYPPGSVIKPLVMAAAIEEGVAKWNYTFYCGGGVMFGNFYLKCTSDHSQITLRDSLVYSCNATFGELGMRLGMSKLRSWMHKFKLDCAMPMVPGSVAAVLPKLDSPSAPAEAAIGQADTLVSPLHMARVAAIIARGGVDIEPRLLRGQIRSYNDGYGTVWQCPEGKHEQIIPPETAALVKLAMIGVVEEGTGYGAQIPGVAVAGKTGSAENPHGDTHAWFIGFAPADEPRVCVAVVLENVGGGGRYAAPVAKSILQEALNVRSEVNLPSR
ncbi:MAG: peptidoglycan D,D-transpeptidase FtsI family protein [Candidatus Bruticola sp.]